MKAKTPKEPKRFFFSPENLTKAEKIIARYPEGKQASAVLPLLAMAQKQNNNWLPKAAMDYVAKLLDMPPVRVHEVATFYSMFNLKPVGEHHIQVCRATPCWLSGSDKIVETCRKKLGIGVGEVTADGKFSLAETECLGACACAPVAQINDDYLENLTPEEMEKIIADLKANRKAGKG